MMLTYNPKDFDVFIGIDVSKLTFSFTTMDHHDLKRSKLFFQSGEFDSVHQESIQRKKIICAYEPANGLWPLRRTRRTRHSLPGRRSHHLYPVNQSKNQE